MSKNPTQTRIFGYGLKMMFFTICIKCTIFFVAILPYFKAGLAGLVVQFLK
jgi:hypothetical protein